MKTIYPGYGVEVDKVEKPEWSDVIKQFIDASVYQTWSYGSVRWGKKNLSHMVLRKNGEIASAAQVRILRAPVIGGIAYVRWGPLWKVVGREPDLDSLREMTRLLIEEYAVRRGLLLRLLPNEIEGETAGMRSVLENEGFRWRRSAYRTILMDLAPSLESLRANLRKEWRYSLKRAEKAGMRIKEGTSDELFAAFVSLYDQMVQRKQFVPGVDVNEYKAIQSDLGRACKMRILICEFNDEPVGGVIGSLLGNTGIYVLGATGAQGLKLGCSYLLQWRMIEWLREKGARYYDLNGFDPEGYPGTSFFKAGISRNDVRYLGEFDACRRSITAFSIKSGDLLRSLSFKAKRVAARFRTLPSRGRSSFPSAL